MFGEYVSTSQGCQSLADLISDHYTCLSIEARLDIFGLDLTHSSLTGRFLFMKLTRRKFGLIQQITGR